MQWRSPHVRNQVVANLPAICLVTGQVLREIPFFVEEPRHYAAAQQDGAMLEITVTDDGAGLDANFVAPLHHGIANTRERLQALY